jgi:hypothetical protein
MIMEKGCNDESASSYWLTRGNIYAEKEYTCLTYRISKYTKLENMSLNNTQNQTHMKTDYVIIG